MGILLCALLKAYTHGNLVIPPLTCSLNSAMQIEKVDGVVREFAPVVQIKARYAGGQRRFRSRLCKLRHASGGRRRYDRLVRAWPRILKQQLALSRQQALLAGSQVMHILCASRVPCCAKLSTPQPAQALADSPASPQLCLDAQSRQAFLT